MSKLPSILQCDAVTACRMSISISFRNQVKSCTLPAYLRRAHEANDEVLERIYIGRRFKNDTERLEKLFDLYTKMTTTPYAAKRSKRGNA